MAADAKTLTMARVQEGRARPDPLAVAPRKVLTLVICCASLFVTTLDGTILNVALPSIQHNFQSSASGLQWTIDAYVLVRASSLFLAGSLGDHFGRRSTLNAGLLMFTFFSGCCALSPNLGSLIAFRCLQGAGSALMTPATLGIITNTFAEGRERAQAVGIWSSVTGISTTAGPVLGGFLVQYFGWRSIFLVNVPLGLAALIGLRTVAESKASTARPFDIPGQALICAALVSLTYALIDAPGAGWLSAEILSLFALALASSLGFVICERRSPHPLLEVSYFRNPALVGAVVVAVVAFIAYGGFLFLNILFLQEVRGYSPLHSGVLTIPTTAAALFLSPIAGRITGSRGPRLPACAGAALICIALTWLAIAVRPGIPLWSLFVSYFLLGFGFGFVNPPITNATVAGLPKDRGSVAGAITATARQMGTNLGVALIGSIVFSLASAAQFNKDDRVLSGLGAASYSHALQYGYGLIALLAFLATLFGLWSFRPDVINAPQDKVPSAIRGVSTRQMSRVSLRSDEDGRANR